MMGDKIPGIHFAKDSLGFAVFGGKGRSLSVLRKFLEATDILILPVSDRPEVNQGKKEQRHTLITVIISQPLLPAPR